MDPILNANMIRDYNANLSNGLGADHSAYALVPRWGNYVGNGANDAWATADAALKTWPSLVPAYAAKGAFPRTASGAVQAIRLLRTLQAAEAKAGVGDPLHVGFGGDPEQKAAFDHDFEHGVAAAAGDLPGEVAANVKFAVRSKINSLAASGKGDLVRAQRDRLAAEFIGGGEVALDAGVESAHAVHTAADGAAKSVGDTLQGPLHEAAAALRSLRPH